MSEIQKKWPYVRLPAGIKAPSEYAEDNIVAFGAVGDVAYCVVHVDRMDFYNGYVLVPEGSSLEKYSDSNHFPHPELPDEVEFFPHGGVTFSQNGWLGFDTGHAGDYWPDADPGSMAGQHWCSSNIVDCRCIYWTVEKVIEEAQRFAHFIGQWDERHPTTIVEQVYDITTLKEIE